MDHVTHIAIVNFIWNIADDVLRDVYVRGKYRDVILPMTVIRRLDCLLEPTKEEFLSKDINLSTKPVQTPDGKIIHEGLTNHGMGYLFEELIRRFNEDNNEEAGEHFTPRDIIQLMVNLIFLPIKDLIESGTYLIYDCACGSGGMLTEAEAFMQKLADDTGKKIAIQLYGQKEAADKKLYLLSNN